MTFHPNMIFPILTNKNRRDEINQKLFDKGIGTRTTWLPAHRQKWHKKYLGNLKLKNTEEISSRVISIPIGNRITLQQSERVVKILKKIIL